MILNYVLLDAPDDGHSAIIGYDDAQVVFMPSKQLAQLDHLRLQIRGNDTSDMRVEYIELEGEPPHQVVTKNGETITLKEYVFEGTDHRIVAGYGPKSKLWVVKKHPSPMF
jgi:hypothetical protein